MESDPQPQAREIAEASSVPHGGLIRCGADLVYLAESFNLGMFLFAAGLTAAGSVASIWFAALTARGLTMLTFVFAAVAILFPALALATPRRAYLWLRCSPLRQLIPLGVSIGAVLFNGPDSPSWWVALPFLWVVASVSTTEFALAGALLTAGAYLAGTVMGGEALVHRGDAGILAAAVALAANTLVYRLVAERFARLILHLHELEARTAPARRSPVNVPNLAEASSRKHATSAPPVRGVAHTRVSKLTSRELEVVLLLRDGLSHAEIAGALGITTRQVERLLMTGRERAGARTAGELLAMLVTGQLVPPPLEAEDG